MRRAKKSLCLVAVAGVIAAGLLSFQAPAGRGGHLHGPGVRDRDRRDRPAVHPGRSGLRSRRPAVRLAEERRRPDHQERRLLPTPFIDLSAKVNTFDDRGFWGFAFDPDFATNGYVYMTYTFENAGNPNGTGPRTSRLTRVTANPANPDVALAGTETVILGSVGIAAVQHCPAPPTASRPTAAATPSAPRVRGRRHAVRRQSATAPTSRSPTRWRCGRRTSTA